MKRDSIKAADKRCRTFEPKRATPNTGIADRLKMVRQTIGVSQTEMGTLLSLGKRSWQRYESGANIPGGSVIAELAARGFDANWILTGEGKAPGDEPDQDSSTWIADGVSRYYISKNKEEPTKKGVDREAVYTRLRYVSHALADLEREAGWKPPLYWHELIKTLMYVHGLDESGAARLLEALRPDHHISDSQS